MTTQNNGTVSSSSRAVDDGCSGFCQLKKKKNDYQIGSIQQTALELLTVKDYVPPTFPVELPAVDEVTNTEFGKNMKKKYFYLDDEWGTFINHGAFGSTLKPALEFAQAFERYIDTQPLRFFDREVIPHMVYATRRLAEFLGLDPKDIVLMDNVTTAINCVVKNFNWTAGDKVFMLSTTYGAVKKLMNHICDTTGAVIKEVKVTFPLTNKKQLIDLVDANLETGTKLAMFDHIPSVTPFIMPLEEIVSICHDRGVPVLIDGAHAIPNLDLNLSKIQPDYYVANCHKWFNCPKGVALLYVRKELQESTRCLVMSHGTGQGFNHEFIWTGLKDYTSFLALHTVIDFWQAIGVDKARAYMTKLRRDAANLLCTQWKTSLLVPEDMSICMVSVRLPEDLYKNCGKLDATKSQVVQDILYHRFKVEVPVKVVDGHMYVRISAHIYNVMEEYERLAEVILKMTDMKSLEKALEVDTS